MKSRSALKKKEQFNQMLQGFNILEYDVNNDPRF